MEPVPIPVDTKLGPAMDEFSERVFKEDDSMRAVIMITVQEKDHGPTGNADIHMTIRANEMMTPGMVAEVLTDMAAKLRTGLLGEAGICQGKIN